MKKLTLKKGDKLKQKVGRGHYAVRNIHKDNTITLVYWLTEKYVGRYDLEYINKNFEVTE